MKFDERIRYLRIKHDMTQKDLSKLIDVSVVSIGGWENGTRMPSADALVSLAQVFSVSVDYLLGITTDNKNDIFLLSQSEKKLLHNYRILDKYGRIAVENICLVEKRRIESEKNMQVQQLDISHDKNSARYIPKYVTPSAAGVSIPLDGDGFEMILVDDSVPFDADFAVTIQGDSMSPYIHDGDTVYVKKGSDISVGDIGIFCVDGAMYCKQYYCDEDNGLILLSANTDLKHTNISVNADSETNVKCYGKVLLGYQVGLPDYIQKK